jgi:hypothetical protein
MAALQTIVLLIVTQGVGGADSQIAVADDKQSISLDEIVRTSQVWRSSITSLQYSAEIEGRVLETPEGVIRILRRQFAAADGHRFSESQHLWEGMSWEDDIKWTRAWMRPSEVSLLSVVNRFCTMTRRYSDVTTNPKLVDIHNDLYLACSGWWPVSTNGDALAPVNALHRLFQDQDISVIDCDTIMNGHRCVLLKVEHASGSERLWLDRECGYVLVKRRRYNAKTSAELVIENDEFREVAPGIVLPRKVFRCVRLVDSAAHENVVLTQSVMHITRLAINEISSEQFVADLPPGTMIYDDDTRELTVLPGGRDEVLNDVIRISSRIPSQYNTKSRMLSPQDTATLGYAAAIGGLLGLLLSFLMEMRYRRLKDPA